MMNRSTVSIAVSTALMERAEDHECRLMSIGFNHKPKPKLSLMGKARQFGKRIFG